MKRNRRRAVSAWISGGLRRTAAVSAVATTAFIVSLTPAAADQSERDRAAFAVRYLQSQMMVAALSCDMRGSYNAAVDRFEAELIGHGQALRRYFNQAHGPRGQRELDRFITAMANEASSLSLAAGAGYCGAAGTMFDEVMALPVSALGAYSLNRFDPDGDLLPRIESAQAQ